MTQAVTSINQAFAGQALKYMQGESLKDKSLFQEVKGAAVGSIPFALAFDTVPTLFGARKIMKKEGKTFMKALEAKTSAKLNAQNTKNYGKVAKFFKIDKLSNWYSKTKFGGSKFGGFFKGATSMFLMTSLFELMEVVPAFKNGGIGAGLKQTVKSAGNVVVDGLMYTAGAKLGTMAGAAIGGPVGALIGGLGGMILGGALNTLGRGLLDKVLGKNYSVKKQEQDIQKQAEAIAQDSASLAQVKDAVQAQIVAKAQSGKELTEDDKQMLAMAQAVDTGEAQTQKVAAQQQSLDANSVQIAQNAQDIQALQNSQALEAPQTVAMTPEEQEEAELIARLQKVDNPQFEYQIPDDFSVDA